MRTVRVENRSRRTELARRVVVAERWWQRLRGLLARPPLAMDEGLLLVPCRSVHTLGMRYAIDVALLDGEGRVVAVYPRLRPGRGTRIHAAAHQALELPGGTLERTGTRPGDVLAISAGPSS